MQWDFLSSASSPSACLGAGWALTSNNLGMQDVPPRLSGCWGGSARPSAPAVPGAWWLWSCMHRQITLLSFPEREDLSIYIYIYRQRYIYIFYICIERERNYREISFIWSRSRPAGVRGRMEMAALRPRPARSVPPAPGGHGGHQHPKAINKSNKSVCHSLRTARQRQPLLPAPALGGGFGSGEGLGDKMMVRCSLGNVAALVPWDGAVSAGGGRSHWGSHSLPAAALGCRAAGGSCPCHCQRPWVPQGTHGTQGCRVRG